MNKQGELFNFEGGTEASDIIMYQSGAFPMLKDAQIAKNYLTEDELKALNNLVSGYFDFAELAARRHRVMRMEDYLKQLDSLLTSIGEQVLEHNGHVSHEQAMQKAEREYRIYQQIELSPVERDYLLSISELKQATKKDKCKKG